jgi:hypothetical protein
MRGEGICEEVSRSTAAFRDWRSCTSLFHQGRRSSFVIALHLLRLEVRDQCVDSWLKLPVHHLFELVNGEADAMIRQPVLGEIVGSNLLRTVARPYHLLTFFRQCVRLLLHLDFVQPRT